MIDWGTVIAGGSLAAAAVGGIAVVSRRAGELVGEVRGARQEMRAEVQAIRGEVHGLTEWLTKVETRVERERESADHYEAERERVLADLRVSVARIEGKLDAEHRRRDSERSLRPVGGPEG